MTTPTFVSSKFPRAWTALFHVERKVGSTHVLKKVQLESIDFQQTARICSAQSGYVQPLLNNNTKDDRRAGSMAQGHDEIDHVCIEEL